VYLSLSSVLKAPNSWPRSPISLVASPWVSDPNCWSQYCWSQE
jgi:hypothetical protein